MVHYYHFFAALELIPLAIGSFYLKNIKQRFLYLYIFVLVAVISESCNLISINLGKHNLWTTQIYFPLEFLLFSLLYLKEFRGYYNIKLMKLVIGGVMIYSILNPIFIQDFTDYSHVRSYSSIILVVYSLLYYYQVMIEAKIQKLSREPMIWVNTAVLLYFAGSLFYNVLFMIILENSRGFSKIAVSYFGILNSIFYVLLTIAFIKANKQYKTAVA